MFDSGIADLINGTDIDRPRNAITLTNQLHHLFSEFRLHFQATDQPHTYLVDSNLPSLIKDRMFPLPRSVYLTHIGTSDPPSPRLLAVQNAISQIFHLSGAGGYIDDILHDMEYLDVKEDGSTALGHLVQLRFDGWLERAVNT